MKRTLDVVYPLKKKSQYEELRYSLRSLKNIQHGKVIIAGAELPSWLSPNEVIWVPVQQVEGESKFENAERNWLEACKFNGLSDDFIAMNDDFYFMKPVKRLRYYHDGDLSEYIKYREELKDTSDNYMTAMQQTLKLLQEHGIKKPKGYTLHIPMVMNRHLRIKLHKMFEHELSHGQFLLMKTLYANIFDMGGKKHVDVKYHNDNYDADATFLSTNDAVFKHEEMGEFIRSTFSEKSQYEK